MHARVENSRGDHEEAEEEDLNDEAADDDVGAVFGHFGFHAHETGSYVMSDLTQRSVLRWLSTGCLEKKGENVACHEDLGHPFDANQAVLFGVDDNDKASEFHVYTGSEQGRGHKGKNRLYNKRTESPIGGLVG